MDNTVEIGTGIPTTEASRTAEKRETREQVVEALNASYAVLEKVPEDKLTPKEQAARELIRGAKAKTIDQDRFYYLNHFKDEQGHEYRQREYMPVDELIDFLTEQIKSDKLSEDEVNQYQDYRGILIRNSKSYYRIPNRTQRARLNARVKQEYDRIQVDPRLTTGNPQEDYFQASQTITKRRELVPPPKQKEKQQEDQHHQDNQHDDGSTVQEIRRDFVIARRDVDIRKRAAELAEEQLRGEMRRGSAFNPLNWPRKIRLRILEEYYRQQYIGRAESAMIANNNSYLDMDVVHNAMKNANENIDRERVAGRSKVEQIKTQAQEGINLEGTTLREATGALKESIMSDIIRPIVNGADSPLLGAQIQNAADVQRVLRAFVEQHQNNPDVQAIFGRDATQFGRLANYFASDILETAEAVRADLAAHKYAIEQLNEVVRIQLANTSWAAETQANFNQVDRAVAWAERHRLTGILINPATIGIAFSLGTYGLMRAANMGAKAMVWVPGAGMLAGGLFAAFRRNYDLKVDRASYQVENVAYNAQFDSNTAHRREALQRYDYNVASVNELLNGGGQEMLTTTDRRSMQELLAADLTVAANQEALTRRMTEIRTRLDFSAREKVDLIKFTGGRPDVYGRTLVEQGRLELVKAIVQSTKALRDAGLSEVDITALSNRFSGEWSNRFTKNREQQDRAFAHYRLRNAIGAGVFAGVAGFAGGLITQEAWAQIGRHVFNQQIGDTVLEKLTKGDLSWNPLDWMNPTRAQGFASDTAKELYNHPGNTPISHDLTMRTFFDQSTGEHKVDFLDTNQHQITGPPMHLTPDGHIITSGDVSNLPSNVRQFVEGSGWQNHAYTNPDLNIHEKIQDYISGNQHEIFTHGNTIINLDAPNHTIAIEDWPTKTIAHGIINPDGSFTFDKANPENANIDWTVFTDRLHNEAWGIHTEIINSQASGGTVLDQLLSQNPDALKTRGIIETDQFKKTWNFHVLRPDIVSATGNHTHNELTLHLGGEYQVGVMKDGQVIPGDLRHGMGNPGELNFGGEIHGGLIQSHLTGVAPADDPQLDRLIQNNHGLRLSDMVFVVDLTNGKQIMVPSDALGNAKLPTELFDPSNGHLRGVESIASAFLEKQDGTLLKAGDLVNSGQVPGGTILHSLTSERFLPGEVPPLPPVTHEIINIDPPNATEFTPPPPTELAPPPIIPIPFAPRHPLEPIDRRIIIYYPGGEPTAEERSFYEQRRSPRLNSNPQGTLNANEEIDWYLSQQSPEYKQELERMNSTIGEPMTSECRVAVCIAAASHQEGKNIYKTLLQYTDQRDSKGNLIDPGKYEIILFLNRPDGTTPDNTASEVKKFQREHPEIKARIIEKVFPARQPMGIISKYVADMALLRSRKRTNPIHADLIMATNDADAELVSKGYINAIIRDYENPQKKHIDAALGKIDWDPESFIQYPGFHVANRFIQYIDATIRHSPSKRAIGSSGANFTMKSSIYAAIGGYIEDHGAGQDVDLSKMIKDGRRPRNGGLTKDNFPIDYINPAWIVTNPRRGVSYYRQGRPIVRQWSDFDSRQGIRENDWRSKTVAAESIDTMDIEHLQNDINATIEDYGVGVNSDNVKRALGFLNIKYKVESGKVILIDISKLKEDLREYARESRNRINELKNQKLTGGTIPTPAVSSGRAGRRSTSTARTPTPSPIVIPSASPTPVATVITPTIAPAVQPTTTIQPITVEATRPQPEALPARIDRELAESPNPTASPKATPQEVVNYLKTIPLGSGAHIEELIPRMDNGQLFLSGKIPVKKFGAPVGSAKFNIRIDNNPTGGVSVIPLQMELTGAVVLKRAEIDNAISNINTLITAQLNKQISDKSWEATGFHIAGDELAFDFRKKPTP
ncbi:MAG: hypothetical protein Q7S44_01435 [bacterium]|nr:hypothetical protein [bacterium]